MLESLLPSLLESLLESLLPSLLEKRCSNVLQTMLVLDWREGIQFHHLDRLQPNLEKHQCWKVHHRQPKHPAKKRELQNRRRQSHHLLHQLN